MSKKTTETALKIITKPKAPSAGRRKEKTEDLKEQRLTMQQEDFCKHYVLTKHNGTQSVRKAYPNVTTDKSASVMASRLLDNVRVQARIAELKKSAEETLGLSLPAIVNDVLRLAADTPRMVYESRDEIEALPEEQRAMIKSVEMVEEDRGTPLNPRKTRKFKVEFYSKLECIKIVADMLGYTKNDSAKVIIQQNNLFQDTQNEFKSNLG